MKTLRLLLAISLLLAQSQAQSRSKYVTKVLSSHQGPIIELALMANGYLVSASSDKTLKMWNATATGDFVKTINTGSVTSMKVLPSGDIACGSDDWVKIWDGVDGTLVKSKPYPANQVNELAVLPDGNLAIGLADGKISLWHLSSSAPSAVLSGHTASVTSLEALSTDKLVSASKDRTIKIWSLTSYNALIRSIDSRNAHATSLVNLPDGRIVAGFEDGSMAVWSSSDGSLLNEFPQAHSAKVVKLAFLRQEGLVASGSADKTIKIWDSQSWTLDGQISDVDVTRFARLDNGQLAVASSLGTITTWDVMERTMKRVIGGLRFSAAKNLLTLSDGNMASSDGRMIHIWSPSDESIIKTFDAGSEVTCLTSLPSGEIASGGKDMTIRLWSRSALVGSAKTTSPLTKLVNLREGKLASAAEDGTIIIWETSAPRLAVRFTLKRHQSTVTSLSVFPNGNLASASLDGSVVEWNPDTGKLVRSTGGFKPIREIVALDADNLTLSYVAENANSKKVHILDLSKQTLDAIAESHFGPVTIMSNLTNGFVATGSIDRTVKIWDPARQVLVETLVGHTKAPASIEILSDGQLVTSSANEIVFWDYSLPSPCKFNGILTNDNLRCEFKLNYLSSRAELNGGNIRSIDVNAFKMFKKLSQVQLGGNKALAKIEMGTFSTLVDLDKLELFDCQLGSFDGNLLENSSFLTELNLQENRLSEMPRDLFKYTPALEKLWIKQNSISDIDVTIFDQVCLKILDLDENPIKQHVEIKTNGKGCHRLFDKRKYTDLSQEFLSSLGYLDREKVQALELIGQNIYSIDSDAFRGFKNARILDLTSNSIETLTSSQFSDLESLEDLTLTKNQLATLPDDLFKGLTNLRELRLNRNFLANITEEMFIGLEQSLETIDLRDNLIKDTKDIDKNTFDEKYINLKRIYLAGNPIAIQGSTVLSQYLCGQRCVVIV